VCLSICMCVSEDPRCYAYIKRFCPIDFQRLLLFYNFRLFCFALHCFHCCCCGCCCCRGCCWCCLSLICFVVAFRCYYVYNAASLAADCALLFAARARAQSIPVPFFHHSPSLCLSFPLSVTPSLCNFLQPTRIKQNVLCVCWSMPLKCA